MIWNAVIFGPHDTPFEDGTFKLTIEFTEEYPNKPPTVRFVSKVFHPNVYADGGICLDILQNRWSPTYDVSAILTSIQVSGHNSHNFNMLLILTHRLIGLFGILLLSHYWAIPIPTHRQTQLPPSCIKRIVASMRSVWKPVWSKVSSISHAPTLWTPTATASTAATATAIVT